MKSQVINQQVELKLGLCDYDNVFVDGHSTCYVIKVTRLAVKEKHE